MTDQPSDRASDVGFVDRLFGRDGELAALRSGLDAVFEGAGVSFLLEGEAGIGKTRLAEQLSREARERGARVAWGRAWDGEGAGAYWPWIEILRNQVCDETARGVLSSLGASARVLAVLDPGLVEEPAGPDEPQWRLDDKRGRFRLFDTLTRLFEALSRTRPLVLVVDDLQAADRSSLLLFEHLAVRLREARVLLIATRRDGEPGKHPGSERWVEANATRFQRIRLAGLEAEHVAKLVHAMTGRPPAQETVRMLLHRTNGNPFFLDEAVRFLAAQEGLDPRASVRVSIPTQIHLTIRDRLKQLSADALEALRLAAILGQEFDVPALEQAADVPRGHLASFLAEAKLGGFIVPVPGEGKRWGFVHGLVRESLEDGLASSRKAELHAAVARILESELAWRPSAGVARVAHHWYHAIPVAGPAKALEYTRAAGDAAMEIAAYENAEALYERALDVLRITPARARDECDLLVLLGRARQRAGDQRAALETYRAAADRAVASNDRQRFAEATLGFVTTRAETGHPAADVVAMLEEALEDAESVSPELRARLIARLAIARYFQGAITEAEELSLEAIGFARRAGAPAALAAAWNARHFALWGSPDLDARLEIATNVIRQADRAKDLDLALDGRLWKITDLLEARSFGAVEAEIEALEAQAQKLGLPTYRWASLVARSMWTVSSGILEESERLADEAFELGLAIGEENAAQFHGIQVSMVRSFQKRFGELEAPVRVFVEQYPRVAAWRAALALLYAESGQLAEARVHFEVLAQGGFSDIPRDGTWLGTIAPLVYTCWHIEDDARAPALRDLLQPHRHRGVVQALGVSYNGSVELFYALMSALAGNWREAEAVFDGLAAAPDTSGSLPVNGMGLLDHARSILRYAPRPDTARVRELLERANALFRRCRMDAWLEEGERLARALAHAESTGGDLRSLDGLAPRRAVVRCRWAREGHQWLVGRTDTPLRFDDAKGFLYVMNLLRQPRTPFDASALYAKENGGRSLEPELARIYVTRSIGRVRSRISKADPVLGAHLDASIRTGRVCRYEPSGDLEVIWDVEC